MTPPAMSNGHRCRTSCGSAGPPSIDLPDGDGAGTGASVAFDAFAGTAITNMCYFDVFRTPPKGGKPSYMLARCAVHQGGSDEQVLNDADASMVQSYLDEAAALLAQYDNNQKIPKKSPDGERAKEARRIPRVVAERRDLSEVLYRTARMTDILIERR